MNEHVATPPDIGVGTAVVSRRWTGAWKSILVASDGSAVAHAALTAAVDLATRSGASLHLVTAYELPEFALSAFPVPVSVADRSSYEAAAFALLETEGATAAALGADVSGMHTGTGAIHDVIIKVAEQIDADLIVVGNRELHGLKLLVGGSTSAGVVHGAHCPVLIVRGEERSWPPRGIVVGFDYSPASRRAAQTAMAIMRLYPDTAMTLIQVLADSAVHPNAVLRRPERVDTEHASLDLEAAALSRRIGRPVGSVLAVGDPADVLTSRSDSATTPDLVVVGARGLGGVRRLVLGSVSTKILHSGHSPLLVIPENRTPESS
jgi:nucleotide-binding universal stress UspA family protein